MRKLICCIAMAILITNAFAQTQIGLDIDGEAVNDYSGTAVSLSDDGTRVAIGASENDGNGSNSGQVRVYDLDVNNQWVQYGADIDGNDSGDYFGHSVAISGDGSTLVSGALFANPPGTGAGGETYVYRDVGGSWVQLGGVIAGANSFDYSGTSVDITEHGNTVIIGAPSYSVNAGTARVYSFDGTNWIQKGQTITGVAIGDLCGASVAISSGGNIIAVGSTHFDGVNGTDSGQVRLFSYFGGAWLPFGSGMQGEAAGDWFGNSCALSDSGDTLVVGAFYNDMGGPSNFDRGHARVFRYNGSWGQIGADIDAEQNVDYFGVSVAISGDGKRVAIGGNRNDGSTGVFSDDRGHVRLFEFDGTNWIQEGADIDGENMGDWSGKSVALDFDGDHIAIGALNNNAYAGHTRIYFHPTAACPSDYQGANRLIGVELNVTKYETDGIIESEQLIGGSADVIYDSSMEILLDNGFCTDPLATFHAYIDGCLGL